MSTELDKLIEESELELLRQHDEKKERAPFYEKAVRADKKAIANFDALPRPLRPPARCPVRRKCRCAEPEYHPINGHDPGCIFDRGGSTQ